MDLNAALNNGVEQEIGGKKVRLRALKVREIADLKAMVKAENLRAIRMAFDGDASVSEAEKSKRYRQIACEPVTMSDLFPQPDPDELRKMDTCPSCGSVSVKGNIAAMTCETCGHQYIVDTGVDPLIQAHAMWYIVRDQHPDFKTFEAFEDWIASLSPDDMSFANSAIAGLSSSDGGSAGDESNPTSSSPTGSKS